MRLFVIDPSTNEKIYLKQVAPTRDELARSIGSYSLRVSGYNIPIQKVIAEPSDNTAESMALGGVVGVLGGVPGVIIGGIIGGLLGNSSKEEDAKRAEVFNRS
ncbi:MAG: hypothetical protein GKR94_00575 [Gammaproteobacteria bacterium]|nr:hypothetical protein [Gammaproteobacteria bacterium]